MTGVELEIILKAGKILLSSGAEISRTEDTMNYIARAMNFKDLEAYVSNRGIFATAKKLMELKLLVFITFLKSILTSVKLNLLMLSPDVSHKKILLLRRLKVNLIKLIPCQTILFLEISSLYVRSFGL